MLAELSAQACPPPPDTSTPNFLPQSIALPVRLYDLNPLECALPRFATSQFVSPIESTHFSTNLHPCENRTPVTPAFTILTDTPPRNPIKMNTSEKRTGGVLPGQLLNCNGFNDLRWKAKYSLHHEKHHSALLFVRFVQLHFQLPFRALGHQVRTDKGIQVSIQHAVYITNLKLRAVVLDQPVRLHHVRADLAAKGNFQLALIQFVGVRLALLDLFVVQPRAQHLHRQFAILALAALRLASHYYVRRQVRDAHRGFHLVYVLSALAAGAKSIHAQLFRPDINFDAVVNFRNHEHRRKRSMPPRRLVKRRNAHQPVHPGFARQHVVRVVAREFGGRVVAVRHR